LIYTGDKSDIQVTESWNEYVGTESIYSTASLWNIARKEGEDAVFLTPQEAVDAMTIEEGFTVNSWASEPMITQPMAFCWDDRGRLWVAENRDYENRMSGFSNDGNSRILILEDTDRDGVADSRKVFVEGIAFPSAIAVGFNGLWLGAPPNLMFIPDRNNDDKADIDEIEVRLTGWGIRDRHETLNSFHWGPDGWLYGLEGFATPSRIRKPAGEGKVYRYQDTFPNVFSEEGVDINGGVWRYHPIREEFEVVAHGFSNPWGIDYDSKGEMFITACVIPHLFHVIPGGIYHRQGGQHFNPYVYEDIRTIVDHSHRSAHGGARIYQSDAFPQSEVGKIFMANIHEHAVLSDVLTPHGSGFIASHGQDVVKANNAQWIGFSMEVGPDGNLYVLDWHDADICGNSVKNKETGRIFRVTAADSRTVEWEGRYDDLKALDDVHLVDLQTSKSDWHSRRSRLILQERASQRELSQNALDKLWVTYEKGRNSDYRLRAFWTLHICNLLATEDYIYALKDKDPYIRSWAVQFIGENKLFDSDVIQALKKRASRDKSAAVRLDLASILQKIPPGDRLELINILVTKKEDTDDHNIPKMIWFAMEPMIASSPTLAISTMYQSELPLVTRFIARRLMDADQLDLLLETLNAKSQNIQHVLTGIRDGLEGRNDLVMPDAWDAARIKLLAKKEYRELLDEISRLLGDQEAGQQLMADLLDDKTPVDEKNKAIAGLAHMRWAPLVDHYDNLMGEDILRLEMIRALASFDVPSKGRGLLEMYPQFSDEEKLASILTLSSRSSYGQLVVEALRDGTLSKKDIPAYVARQLRRVVGNGFVEIWGPIDELSYDLALAYKKYEAIAEEATSIVDHENGESIYKRTCGACHQLYSEGGIIGPDLTGSNRGSVDYLLTNILEPSADIQDDYRMVILTTQDGRTFTGNIINESDRMVTIRDIGGLEMTISKSQILSRETSDQSLMPVGLLETLSEEEVSDLLGYLMHFRVENEL
jgi:putative membrane-bound dehydrogenase-like protein